MILGMTRATFVIVHSIISVIGIGAGLVVLYGLLTGRLFRIWNGLFLFTTILTSASGFLFPSTKITPGIILGIVSLVLLAVALLALYGFHLRGGWRTTYIVTAMIPLYFNLVILVLVLFQRVPVLNALAASRSGGPIRFTQIVLLLLTIVLTTTAARRFRPTVHRVTTEQ